MSKENFESVQASIEAIEDAETKVPNMPVDTFLQEAANLHEWSKADQPQLLAVGIPQELFDELPTRTGALRYTQSVWMKERYSQDEARQEWEQKSPDAIALKDSLEHSFRFAFRRRPDLLTKVQAIEEGTGNADMVQDLSDLAVLGKANLPLLEAINFDTTQLDTAETQATEMSQLLAIMNGERVNNNAAKITRDKAYTYLKQAVDEIREAGKFVFWKDEKRLRGYRSQYFRNR